MEEGNPLKSWLGNSLGLAFAAPAASWPQLEEWCFYWFWDPLISLSYGRRRELQELPSSGSMCFMPATIQAEKHSWWGADLLNFTAVPHHPRAVSAFQTHTAVLKALQHIWAVPCSLLAQSSSVCSATAFRKAENQSPYCTYWFLLHWGDLVLQRNTTSVLWLQSQAWIF